MSWSRLGVKGLKDISPLVSPHLHGSWTQLLWSESPDKRFPLLSPLHFLHHSKSPLRTNSLHKYYFYVYNMCTYQLAKTWFISEPTQRYQLLYIKAAEDFTRFGDSVMNTAYLLIT